MLNLKTQRRLAPTLLGIVLLAFLFVTSMAMRSWKPVESPYRLADCSTMQNKNQEKQPNLQFERLNDRICLAPLVDSPIDDIYWHETSSDRVIGLDDVFQDSDGTALVYTIGDENAAIVDADINGSDLLLQKMTSVESTASVTVTATQANGEFITDTFTITIPDRQFPISLDGEGWTELSPSVDSRVVYVSSSTGDDANSGLSPGNAVASIAHAKTLMRDGYPDWMLLQKGDTWEEGFGTWRDSGRSESEPIVLGTYGTGARPLLKTGSTYGISSAQSSSYVALVGLHFYAHTRDPDSPEFVSSSGNTGINWAGDSWEWLLIEDVKIESHETGLVIQNRQTVSQNVMIRRSTVVDSYATSGHSQGLYTYGLDGLLLEGNVFDHNGWYGDRTTGGSVGTAASATLFNHNMYIDHENTSNVVVAGNIFTRASATGIQVRPGGVVIDNLFVRNPTAVLIGGADSSDVDGIVQRNVILEANDINTASNMIRGTGFALSNIGSLDLSDNIVAHDASASPTNTKGIGIYDDATGMNIQSNIFYDHTPGGINDQGTASEYVTQDNYFFNAAIPTGNHDASQQSWLDSTLR